MTIHSSSKDQIVSLGMVVRNHDDLVMAPSHMRMVEPFEEAYPFPFCYWAWDLGFYILIIEGEDKLLFH